MAHLRNISAASAVKGIAPEVKLTFLLQLLQILPPAEDKETGA